MGPYVTEYVSIFYVNLILYFNFSVSPYVFRQEFLCFFDLFFQNMSYEREQKWLQQLAGEILSDSEVEEAEDKSDNGEQDLIERRTDDSETEQELEYGTFEQNHTERTLNDTETEQEPEDRIFQEAIIEKAQQDGSTSLLPTNLFLAVPDNAYYVGKDKVSKWKKHCHPSSLRSRTRAKNIVTQLAGVKQPAKNLTCPVEIWRAFFDPSILEIIVQHTNAHIRDFAEGKYSRDTYTKPTDAIEIEALIGLLYLCGVKKSNRLACEEIFATDGSSAELFRLTMSMQRFLFLLRHLRFDDHQTRIERQTIDKLAPIREIFQKVVANYKDKFSPSEMLTVDEMLVGFRGKCSFRQYIPSKPAKYGVKIFALADAKMFYTLNMEVYVGKQPQNSPFQVSNSQDVVCRMVEPISGTRRNITTDNWFTSIELCTKLQAEHKLTLLGTIRKNKRQIPSEFVNGSNRPVPSSIFGFGENSVLVSFVPKPKKIVLLLSSMHDIGEVDEVTKKPEMILDYNNTKIGVDMVDQLSANYNVARNTRRWPQVIFYALLNTSGINAFIIYKCNNKNETKAIMRRQFLTNLAIGLTERHLKRRCMDNHLPRPIRIRLKEMLKIPAEEPQRELNEPPRTGRCSICTSRQNRKTKYFCRSCNKFLCLEHSNIVCSVCLENVL